MKKSNLPVQPLNFALPPTGEDNNEVVITRRQLTLLMLESHKKSTTASEEILALTAVGKLNGLFATNEEAKQVVTVNINHIQETVQALSDEELLQMSSSTPGLLHMPEPRSDLEANYVEVPNDVVSVDD